MNSFSFLRRHVRTRVLQLQRAATSTTNSDPPVRLPYAYHQPQRDPTRMRLREQDLTYEPTTAEQLAQLSRIQALHAVKKAKEIFQSESTTPAKQVLTHLRQTHATRQVWLLMMEDLRKSDISVAMSLVRDLPLPEDASLNTEPWSRVADEAETFPLAMLLDDLLIAGRYQDVVDLFDVMLARMSGGLRPSSEMCQAVLEAMLVLRLPVEQLLLRMESYGIPPVSRPRLVARYTLIRLQPHFDADQLDADELVNLFGCCIKVGEFDRAYAVLIRLHTSNSRLSKLPAAITLGAVELTKHLCDVDRHTDALHVCQLYSALDERHTFKRYDADELRVDPSLLRQSAAAMLDQSKFDLDKAVTFGKMDVTNPVGGALVAHLCYRGRIDDALRVVQWAGGCSDQYTLARLVQALFRAERSEDALALAKRLFETDRETSVHTFAIVLQSLLELGENDAAVALFLEMGTYDQFMISLVLSKVLKKSETRHITKLIQRFEEDPIDVTSSFCARQLALGYAQLNDMDRVVHFTVISSRASQWLTFSALFGVLNWLARSGRENCADQIDYVADRVLRLLYRRADRRCIHRVLSVIEPLGRGDLERKWVYRDDLPTNILVSDTTELHGPRSDVARRIKRMTAARERDSSQEEDDDREQDEFNDEQPRDEPRGLIVSPAGNAVFDRSNAKCALTCALNALKRVALKSGTSDAIGTAEQGRGEIVHIAQSHDARWVVAAFSDGVVRFFELATSRVLASASIHRGSANFVAISADDALVATGGDDSTVVILDSVSETSRCRLRGHAAPITALLWIERAASGAVVISASKDALVKLWDVATQHCLHTIVGHRAEVWALAADRLQRRLVTGSNDGLLRVWDIELLWNPAAARRAPLDRATAHNELALPDATAADASTAPIGADVSVQFADPLVEASAWTDAAVRADRQSPAQYIGAIQRRGARGRVGQLLFAPDDDSLLICVPAGAHFVEFYICRDAKGIKKHRRRRRARERARREGNAIDDDDNNNNNNNNEDDADDDDDDADDAAAVADSVASDEFAPLCQLETPHRVRSIDAIGRVERGESLPRSQRLRLLVSMRNNALVTFSADDDGEPALDKDETGESVLQLRAQYAVEHGGHRSDVRHVALSSDDRWLLTGARDGAKVWRVADGSVSRTLDAVSVLSGCFVPGSQHVLLGTKAGELLIYELATQRLLQTIAAHNGPVWSIALVPGSPDAFATGGGDKKLNTWQLELVDRGEGGGAELNARVDRTLELSDDVLSVRFTADGKYVAAALLDHTVKVHFVDSHKFFLSLYGHRLPVMAIDVSSDGALLVSGSSDKNVKIWGLDFGDCHRSLFAHDDAVMAVAFQRNTHYFFSGGKDGRVKYWDADSAELILVLEGHHGPVWSLAISHEATVEPFVVSSGADRTWRVWERTEALVFADEERELRLEARLDAADLERAEHGAGIVDERETAAAARDTAESLKAAERLGEALRLADGELMARAAAHRAKRARTADLSVADAAAADTIDDTALVALHDDGDGSTLPNQLLLGLTPSRYILRQLRDIRRGELDAALLALPLDHCVSLLRYVLRWLEKGIAVELATRTATFVVRSHAGVLARSTAHAALLDALARHASARLREYRDEIGFNEAALQFLQRELESRNVRVFTDTNKQVRDIRSAARKRTASTTL